MNNTTYSVKKNEIERKWYIIDAANKPLGRVATEAARLLAGKHKPIYPKNIQTSLWIHWWNERSYCSRYVRKKS